MADQAPAPEIPAPTDTSGTSSSTASEPTAPDAQKLARSLLDLHEALAAASRAIAEGFAQLARVLREHPELAELCRSMTSQPPSESSSETVTVENWQGDTVMEIDVPRGPLDEIAEEWNL